jgi:ATP-dependent protease Clp ATPase subunit
MHMSKTKKYSINEVKDIIDTCYSLKPEKLFMGELKWKYLVRSALRGKNILLLGPAGQGKTLAVQCLVDAMEEVIEEEVTEERLNVLKTEPSVVIVKIEEIK